MGVLTLVQVIGNVFSSYQYMMLNSTDQIKYFTDSVLFFLQDPDPKVNQVMISYITGAILPIVSLCMTSMVVGAAELDKVEEKEEVITDSEPITLEPKIEDEKINSKIVY